MDIQLPVKDGIEATMEIRAMEQANNVQGMLTPTTEAKGFELAPSQRPSPVTSPSQLPVIIVALTASSLQSDRLAALAAGCNDFITKPVSLQWLQQKLLEWGSMSILSSFSSRRIRDASTSTLPPISTSFFDRQAAQAKASRIGSRLHIDSKNADPSASVPSSSTVTPPLEAAYPASSDTPRTFDSLDDFKSSDDSLMPTRDPKLASQDDSVLVQDSEPSTTRPGIRPIG